MSDNNYQEVIKNNKLFDGIPPQNLKINFRDEQIIRRKEGEIIFQKGDESLSTYLIVAGRVKIKVYIENKSVKLNKSINDFFGEIEVLEDTYRRSAAVANTDCILYALSKGDLRTFLAENPEINDNIIAYNKVEIPELQLTINPGLLKEDTDKLYLSPQPENNSNEIRQEDTAERNELENKRREIEKSAEMILEINGDEEEDSEDEFFEEDSSEDFISDADSVPEEFLSSADQAKEITEPEDYSETALETDHPEDINAPQEPNLEQIAPAGEENVPEKSDPGTEETEEDKSFSSTENVDLEENISPIESEEENPEERFPEKEVSSSSEESSSGKMIDESDDQEDTITSEGSEEESYEDQSYDIKKEYENNPDEFVESADEAASEIHEEALEENELTEKVAEMNNYKSEPEHEETKWINLNPVETPDEFPDDLSEEEKLRYEMEDEKLKYDDTEINAERILDAIRKINSSFDKQNVYSNIVRESVKLTEAQAGLLYRVDQTRNHLVTQIESEEGLVEARYSISSGLTGLAAETGEIINVREPAKDFRYSEDVDGISGIAGTSILCVPVKNENNDTIAVISLANSSSGKFSISDEEKISKLASHISQALLCIDGIDNMLDDNKNTYLSKLTEFITDNIQTPVLTMKYYASQIKKKDVPQDVRTVLSVLMDQADSVVNFLDSTLAFTENQNPLSIETGSLQEVMDDALGLLAEYVESRNVGLYKKVEGNIKVRLDRKAFYQACHQIAKNACDAMGENGNIYITAKQSGDLVNIEFRDTGPGIPEDFIGQIFQPFKSFKKDKGTGLGLTIAQKIIRDHGGELTVESSPEKGATFVISLPVFDEN